MSKVTILTKPNRIVIASKGVQGDVTPEAIAARDAAIQAAQDAAGEAGNAADSADAALGAASAASLSADAAVDAADSASQSAIEASQSADDASAAAGFAGNIFDLEVAVHYAPGLNVDSTRFTVSHDEQVYAPAADALPFTTTGTFNPAQWRLVQGVVGVDLASATGAAMVGYGSGSVKGQLDRMGAVDYLADFEVVPFAGIPIDRLVGAIGDDLFGASGSTLYRSRDGGATWALVAETGVTGLNSNNSRIYGLANGEILINTGPAIFRSSGWSSNPATATFTQTLVITDPVNDRFHTGWGVSISGSRVMVCEYGNPKPTAWKAYLSTNYGASFAEVYDIADHWPGDKSNAHLHGCCIDPHHGDRLWQLSADTGTIGAWYSDDDGATWTMMNPARAPQQAGGGQANYVTMVATPDGIVLGSDDAPNGIALIPRDADYAANPRMEHIHYFVDGEQAITQIGHSNVVVGDTVYTAFAPLVGSTFPSRITATQSKSRMAWIVWEDPAPRLTGRSIADILYSRGYLFAHLETGVGFFRARLNPGIAARSNDRSTYDTGWVLGGKANPDQRGLAVGVGASAEAVRGTSVGQGTVASGISSLAVGYRAEATASEAVAVGSELVAGQNTVASNTGALAFGPRTTAAGFHGTALGYAASASATSATAVGDAAAAIGSSSTAVGQQSAATNTEGTSVGRSATSANRGTAVGSRAEAAGTRSIAVGFESEASAQESIAIGDAATATHARSTALGDAVETTASEQVAIGPRHVELTAPTSNPSAPAAGRGRLFVRTVGGKEEVCVRFKSGAVQVIAAEP